MTEIGRSDNRSCVTPTTGADETRSTPTIQKHHMGAAKFTRSRVIIISLVIYYLFQSTQNNCTFDDHSRASHHRHHLLYGDSSDHQQANSLLYRTHSAAHHVACRHHNGRPQQATHQHHSSSSSSSSSSCVPTATNDARETQQASHLDRRTETIEASCATFPREPPTLAITRTMTRCGLSSARDKPLPSFSSRLSDYLSLSWFQRLPDLGLSSLRLLLPRPIVMAAAATTPQSQNQNEQKEIILLNASNFNPELIQHNHPFPHIKLIEYYLPYCGICKKFKVTYAQLARELHSWRNVIRPSAIDLGISGNSPIAHSWSIDVVPTLRIHPPPNRALASKLNKQLAELSAKLSPSELQKSMHDQYKSANLMISSLGVFKYTNDSKRETLADKVALLKVDLLRYIESFVSRHPGDMPVTWPNLRPVTETSLAALRKQHPRQELFLIVETTTRTLNNNVPDMTATSDSDQSSAGLNLGLSVLMELSSSTAWKSIRYVRACDNRALVEDVIAQKKLEIIDGDNSSNSNDNNNNNNNSGISNSNEQVRILTDLLENKLDADNHENFMLIHVDYSHSPQSQIEAPLKFPFITVVQNSDLFTSERSAQLQNQIESSNRRRARSAANLQLKHKRSPSSDENMDLRRKVELAILYVNQSYTETKEDREFVAALRAIDEEPSAEAKEKLDTFRETLRSSPTFSAASKNNHSNSSETTNERESFMAMINRLNPITNENSYLFAGLSDCKPADDYEDKLKAIRYIFFTEVPRKSTLDLSLVEKQEKLNTLINLISVIKAYFPLPDSASIRFIDGVYSYLTKQQSMISAAINSQDRGMDSNPAGLFDTRQLKQELKRLEAEGRRLPEIKDWKHCKITGYPCALWRLFHTLAAFEYKKLSQIRQQTILAPKNSTNLIAPPSRLTSDMNLSSAAAAAAPGVLLPRQQGSSSGGNNAALPSASHADWPSPVERLVSPPSTTTSLSLTISTSNAAQHGTGSGADGLVHHQDNANHHGNNHKHVASEAELPAPVLLVMRDYITNFFSCDECAKNFRLEAADLSLDRIRQQEPAEFSVLWLWETHNRVSKRLSVDPKTNPNEHPKKWFPSYEQCAKCYKKPPSFLKDTNVELSAIFHESIQWNRDEILAFMIGEYTRQPLVGSADLFGYQVPYGFGYVIVIGICSLALIMLLRCASCYIERQRRHKASLLNGNGAHYSLELQNHQAE